MKLNLPDVTLVLVETREHALAKLALQDTLKLVDFGDVLIVTDKPDAFAGLSPNPRFKVVEDFPTKLGWSRSWWYDVPPLLRTRQTLNIQWDSWVWDVGKWSSTFLDYDYIGAPWWYEDGKNVGNGGFSLVSTRLKRFLRANRGEFPCDTAVDDDLLCRGYRPALEKRGFVWAPEKVAREFAFECTRPSPTSKHFGMHAAFNFGEVLSPDRLLERARLMVRSPYISKPDGYIWKTFCQKYPDVVDKVLNELVSRPSALSN